MNIAVLASGNGSNLQALIEAQARGDLGGGKIVLAAGDKPGALALKRAIKAGIKVFAEDAAAFGTREEFDQALMGALERAGVELVVLAGYMRLLSPAFVSSYEGRIINIHPSLLPAFKGTHGIKDAYDHGVKVTGVTVHFVDVELDNGPIIMQREVPVSEDDTLETLEEKIHKAEHMIYPEAVRLFAEGRLSVKGRKVKILEL